MPKRINVGDRYIGKNDPVFIIAEIGSNHNQDINIAKKLIDIASKAGADAAKFQLFDADELYKPKDELYSVFKEMQLNTNWLMELKTYTESKGLIFFASPFDEKSIHLLNDYGVSIYKWASSEITNLKNLRIAASYNKPMIISTGMCDLADIFEAVEVCQIAGNDEIILLHCISLCPTELNEINLKALDTLKSTFNFFVGLSDHTLGSTAAIASVAMGSKVIEKHITLDRKMNGPDHSFATEPNEFIVYVKKIREAEICLGHGKIEMHPKLKSIGRRKGIHSRVDIKKGQIIKIEMLEIKRPAEGIRPRYLEAIIGSVAKKNICKNKPFTWDLIN